MIFLWHFFLLILCFYYKFVTFKLSLIVDFFQSVETKQGKWSYVYIWKKVVMNWEIFRPNKLATALRHEWIFFTPTTLFLDINPQGLWRSNDLCWSRKRVSLTSTSQHGLFRGEEERDTELKMLLRGSLCQWSQCTVLSGTMTVLTVFRSVSELHKPVQGRAAEGVSAEATVHWTNIITTKALRSAWKGLHWMIQLSTGQ